jgi:streptogramin lyase
MVGIADGGAMAAGAMHEPRPLPVPAVLVGTARSVSASLLGRLACVAVALALSATPALAAKCANGVCAQDAAAGLGGAFSGFPLSPGSRAGQGITTGPDGNVWFVETNSNSFAISKIGRITPSGTIREFPLPTLESEAGKTSGVTEITAGPDGNLWFADANKIGRITPSGTISEFPLATVYAVSITAGPDGNLWFTDSFRNIDRITPSGTVSEFPTRTAYAPRALTAGPDGNLWFTELRGNKIGRITPSGVVSEFSTPTANSDPEAITAGPDGNLWFTEFRARKIGRITPSGTVKEFQTETAGRSGIALERPGITAGPDGNLWFTDALDYAVDRITPSGTVSVFQVPNLNDRPEAITVGPDGDLWFTEHPLDRPATLAGKIGRIDPRLLTRASAAKCVVPRLEGKTLTQAKKLLARAHCRLGRVTRPATHTHTLVVVSQRPAAKKTLPSGAKVSLRLG